MELKQILKQFCLAPAPAGFESEVYTAARAVMEPFGDCHTDARGNFICKKAGSGRHFLLDAHLDQIGFVVTEIEDGGFLKIARVGGTDRRIAPAQEVIVCGKEPLFGVIACKPPHLSEKSDADKAPKIEDLSVDTGMDTARLKALVSVGDAVVFKPYFGELLHECVTATALDDRAGMAIVARAMELLRKAGSRAKVTAVFSVGEEVGGRGAGNASYYAQADEAIAVDVSFAAQPEVAAHHKIQTMPLGGGAFIGFAPILNRTISRDLVQTAKRENIPYAIEAMGGRTGTNADEIAAVGFGTKTVTISPPLRNMHTPVEVAHLGDLEACARLIAAYILDKEGE